MDNDTPKQWDYQDWDDFNRPVCNVCGKINPRETKSVNVLLKDISSETLNERTYFSAKITAWVTV